ncbi:MAG: YkgJ family cysteine cluster protein [Methanoregula sp.]|jgi:hypothetical protein
MDPSSLTPSRGACTRCGECCRWLPIALVKQCKPHQLHYLRERGLREEGGYFLVDSPCRHLERIEPDGSGIVRWGCAIYATRPATCRDFCGKSLSAAKRFYVPASCTMVGGRSRASGDEQENPATGRK